MAITRDTTDAAEGMFVLAPPSTPVRQNVGPLDASEVRHREHMAKLDRLIAQQADIARFLATIILRMEATHGPLIAPRGGPQP